MDKKQKTAIIRISAAAILLIAGVLTEKVLYLGDILPVAVFMSAYLVAGYDTLLEAVMNIRRGQIFDENFLMAIATIGAIGLGDHSEAVFVMLFYLIGETFENYAVNRSRNSISELMDIRPDHANLIKDGKEMKVDPYDVKKDDVIIIKPGERIPLDGEIIEGYSSVDTSSLTGESMPVDVGTGDGINSGCLNMTGMLKVRVSGEYEDSTVAKVLDMVENAGNRKARVEKFITKFARYYTPVVVISAAVMALLPPLSFPGESFSDWISRALIFLVISCPCALVISVPLAFFGGVGGASREGILVKGTAFLEAMADVDTVIFDKTGTITTGKFKVEKVSPVDMGEGEVLELAAYVESYSDHPISMSIKEAYGKDIDKSRVEDVTELAGKGIRADIGGRTVYVGNGRLMRELGYEDLPEGSASTAIYVADEERYLGCISITDTVKENSGSSIKALENSGVRNTIMLTGDRRSVAEKVAEEVGVDRVYSELLPGDKLELAENIIDDSEAEKSKGHVVFVGDGINDAPTLARADVGIAMGGLGSDAAIEAADIIIMDDDLSKISKVIDIAKSTIRIAKQNVVFALSVKVVVMIMGAFGVANMWEAVFADVGVAVIAILNSMRAMKTG